MIMEPQNSKYADECGGTHGFATAMESCHHFQLHGKGRHGEPWDKAVPGEITPTTECSNYSPRRHQFSSAASDEPEDYPEDPADSIACMVYMRRGSRQLQPAECEEPDCDDTFEYVWSQREMHKQSLEQQGVSRAVLRMVYSAVARNDLKVMRKRHETFSSLGSHVGWEQLLEFAGDNMEAWKARRVHKWLGISEEDAAELLSGMLEMRTMLSGDDKLQKTPSPSAAELQGGSQESQVQEDAAPSERKAGFFSNVLSWFTGSVGFRGYSRIKELRQKSSGHWNNCQNRVPYDMDQLEEVGRMGWGSFGAVTLVRCKLTGQRFALKSVSKALILDMEQKESIRMEKAIMQVCDSPFTIKLAATFHKGGNLYLLQEAAMGGDLYTVYQREDIFHSPVHARFYTACVVIGLAHLHARSVVYRDLKMENIVMDGRGYCKLCDFGSATYVRNLTYTLCGTPAYMAPEVISYHGHGVGADWWSVGVLVYEMLLGYTPFGWGDDPMEIFRKVRHGIDQISLPSESWASLVRGLCQTNPMHRLPMLANGGIDNVKEHAWFRDAEFDWDACAKGTLQAPYLPKLEGPEDLSNFILCEDVKPREIDPCYDEKGWLDFEETMGPASMD